MQSVSPGGMQGKLSWVNFALGWPVGSPAYHTPLACRYQQILHRNLVYLATIADSNQNMQSLLPAVSARGAGAAPILPGTARHCLRPPTREQRSEVLPGIAKATAGSEKGQALPLSGKAAGQVPAVAVGWWSLWELTCLPITSCCPQPPTQNMNLGPGALSQSGASQGLHSQGSLSDAISTGLPPASLMQGQIGNGEHPGLGFGFAVGSCNNVTNAGSQVATQDSSKETPFSRVPGCGPATVPGAGARGDTQRMTPRSGSPAVICT